MGGKKSKICIKPVHFSLQVTERDNAVSITFSSTSVSRSNTVEIEQTTDKERKKKNLNETDFTESFMIIFNALFIFLCHAFFSSPNDLTCNTVLFVCLQPCIYCNVHTVMLIVNYLFLLKHHPMMGWCWYIWKLLVREWMVCIHTLYIFLFSCNIVLSP